MRRLAITEGSFKSGVLLSVLESVESLVSEVEFEDASTVGSKMEDELEDGAELEEVSDELELEVSDARDAELDTPNTREDEDDGNGVGAANGADDDGAMGKFPLSTIGTEGVGVAGANGAFKGEPDARVAMGMTIIVSPAIVTVTVTVVPSALADPVPPSVPLIPSGLLRLAVLLSATVVLLAISFDRDEFEPFVDVLLLAGINVSTCLFIHQGRLLRVFAGSAAAVRTMTEGEGRADCEDGDASTLLAPLLDVELVLEETFEDELGVDVGMGVFDELDDEAVNDKDTEELDDKVGAVIFDVGVMSSPSVSSPSSSLQSPSSSSPSVVVLLDALPDEYPSSSLSSSSSSPSQPSSSSLSSPSVEVVEELFEDEDGIAEVVELTVGLGSRALLELEEVTLPVPVNPPVAPEAAILAMASLSVSHAIEVPALLTNGRATHCVPAAQAVVTQLPPTHCAKLVPRQPEEPPKNRYH